MRHLCALLICVAATTTALAQANLSVSLTGEPSGSGGSGSGIPAYSITPGGSALYVMTVRNDGPDAATNLVITLTFPPETTIGQLFVGSPTATCSTSIISGNTTVTCTQPTMAAHTSFLTVITLRLTTNYAWQNGLSATAAITATTPDSVPSNNTASVSLYVAPPAGAAIAPTLDHWGLTILTVLLLLAAVLRATK